MAQPYAIVGVTDSGIQPRLEIRDLQKYPAQFSLFIRALNKVYNMNDHDPQSPNYYKKPNSWWELVAIHGLPYEPWSGDPNGPQTGNPESDYGGYCCHSSVLFPIWHRVVMLLVEQAVVNEAKEIASELEDKEWMQAAKKLRLPFWDWTRLETAKEGIPQIFQQPEIEIANPDGSVVTVRNPLSHYRLASKPGESKGFEYMGNWKRTYRWVNDLTNPTEELYDMAQKAFSGSVGLNMPGIPKPWILQPVQWLRTKVAGLFDYPLTLDDPSYGPNLWGHFSNTNSSDVYVPSRQCEALANIEEPHNMLHLDAGGIGQMGTKDYAGYDPLIFFHHVNIDRIYAFWEYVYPEYWFGNGWKDEQGNLKPFVDESGTFTLEPNTPITHASPLLPFRNKNLDYWTPDDVRGLLVTSPTQKYYTYPAIRDPATGIEVKVDVPYDVKDIHLREKYRQILKEYWSQDLASTVEKIQESSDSHNLSSQLRSLVFEQDQKASYLHNFIIIGTVPEFAFPGSYRLELYLLPSVTKQETPQVINSISIFGRADPARCASCRGRQAAGSQVRGYMHLDPVLVHHLISLHRLATENQRSWWRRLLLKLSGETTDLAWLTNLIKSSLGMRLVTPDRKTLAAADPSISSDKVLEEAKIPELTLYSQRTSFSLRDEDKGENTMASMKVDYGEATNHGKLSVAGGWKVL